MQDRDATGAVMIDIDAELSCWQQMEHGATSELVFLFHEWEPAIRVGIHAYLAYPDRDFDSLEPTITAVYQRIRGGSRIPWTRAAPAARRIWQKLHNEADAALPAAGWYPQRSQVPSMPQARVGTPLGEA